MAEDPSNVLNRQNIGHYVTVCSSLHQFLHSTKGIKTKSDIIIEESGSISCSMDSIVEILCVIKGKVGLVCWQLLYDVHIMDFSRLDLVVYYHHFLSDVLDMK